MRLSRLVWTASLIVGSTLADGGVAHAGGKSPNLGVALYVHAEVLPPGLFLVFLAGFLVVGAVIVVLCALPVLIALRLAVGRKVPTAPSPDRQVPSIERSRPSAGSSALAAEGRVRPTSQRERTLRPAQLAVVAGLNVGVFVALHAWGQAAQNGGSEAPAGFFTIVGAQALLLWVCRLAGRDTAGSAPAAVVWLVGVAVIVPVWLMLTGLLPHHYITFGWFLIATLPVLSFWIWLLSPRDGSP